MLVADIGVFIKQRREKAGYSLKKLASLSGISDSELFKIENGTRQNPNWKNLCEIAKALEIHPFEFLLEADYISETDINPIIRLKGLDKLNSSELDLVQLYVDFLLEKRNEIMEGTGGSK